MVADLFLFKPFGPPIVVPLSTEQPLPACPTQPISAGLRLRYRVSAASRSRGFIFGIRTTKILLMLSSCRQIIMMMTVMRSMSKWRLRWAFRPVNCVACMVAPEGTRLADSIRLP
ncbi:hypothetical protein M752DRAFT_108994 [Aspergillus phoenicis ATCC 13157]|uniref:Uncharacterized protein n=1 Tax=Aspergillus phoenicis ATCC 13157 TaxID=1353007 RepID=A0A370P4Z4_ASPPH|nr:hypothetical protein M752DRAFT_108994 [Aspergillus phoenicis ATCC 13157]